MGRLNSNSKSLFLFLALGLISSSVFAEQRLTASFTCEEFKSLAQELAPKVNLFKEVWSTDPTAEFFGGTTRDYLYWLRRQITSTPDDQLPNAIETLKSKPLIDIRDFVIGDSDVDVVSNARLLVNPKVYGVRKIDQMNASRFDPTTEMGHNEIHQGYIPVEKIRLSSSGFIDWPGFGNGVLEICLGRPTVSYAHADEFLTTYYAKLKLNHPLLLAIRYIRTLGINYFYLYGGDYPREDLLNDIDDTSASQTTAIVQQTLQSRTLGDYLKQSQFQIWLNQAIQKTFRSYTNPTAAYALFQRFHLDKIVSHYSQKIDPINQYLFAKHRDPHVIADNLSRFPAAKNIFESVGNYFPDGYIYHGTRTDQSFRSILLQGILPSSEGSAGPGLYGVASNNLPFAEMWGGSSDRVVKFHINASARLVDLTKPETAKLFNQLSLSHSDFADLFGIDIIKYPYNTHAFVVKNSSILERPEGLTRKILSFAQLCDYAKSVDSIKSLHPFLEAIALNSFSGEEVTLALEESALFRSESSVRLKEMVKNLSHEWEWKSKAFQILNELSEWENLKANNKHLKARFTMKKIKGHYRQLIQLVLSSIFPPAESRQFYDRIVHYDSLKLHNAKDFIFSFSQLLKSFVPQGARALKLHILSQQSHLKKFYRKTEGLLLAFNPLSLTINLLFSPIIAKAFLDDKLPEKNFWIFYAIVNAGCLFLGEKSMRYAYRQYFILNKKSDDLCQHFLKSLQ